MKVYVDESSAGAGKTRRSINNITRKPCKVLMITERKNSFCELEDRILEGALRAGTRPLLRTIHSGTENRGCSVTKEVEELPDRYVDCDHIIAIATHSALLRCDFSRFAGWSIVIDEVPAFLDFEERLTHLDSAYFQRHYALEHVGGQWHAITLTAAGRTLSVADVRADQSHSHLSVFHARVAEASREASKRHVLCNLPDWTAMAARGVKWCWASVFSLRQLEAFDRVELLGNRFSSDIGSVLTKFFDSDEVEWVALPSLERVRPFVHRNVDINYFSTRPSSRSWFESPNGQEVLKEIGAFLAAVLPARNSIWTANDNSDNESDRPSAKRLLALPPADYLSPKQAGTNLYQGISDAAMIYSAKPCPNLRGLLLALGIDSKVWTRSIEFEAILQFMTRTSVRDPSNATPVQLWVFDCDQAAYLKDYFDGLSHVTANVAHVALQIDIPAKKAGGRPRITRTPEEHAAWREEQRQKDADRKRLARGKKAA